MLRLKELRRREKISQQYLADELGVSRSTISMWETGANQPDNDSLNELADYFSVSIDYLLGRTDDAIDYDDGDFIAAIPDRLIDFFDGDVKLAYRAWKAEEQDGASDSQRINKIKPATVPGNELSEAEHQLIQLFRLVPSEKQAQVLGIIRQNLELAGLLGPQS